MSAKTAAATASSAWAELLPWLKKSRLGAEAAWAAATKATSVATARQRASMEELNHKDRTTQRAVAYSHYIAASSH